MPNGVLADALTVRTEEWPEATGLVPKVHVALCGQPVTPKVTEPEKPPMELTPIVEVPDPPCGMENELGLADIPKSAVVTVTVNVVLWVRLELALSVPLTTTE